MARFGSSLAADMGSPPGFCWLTDSSLPEWQRQQHKRWPE
jgi:hypothetical protein